MNEKTTNLTERRSETIGRIKAQLDSAKIVMVVSHLDPDGDALGSQLAFGEYLRTIGKQVVLLRDSDIPEKYQFLPSVETIVPTDSLSVDPPIDTAVILECPTLERVGKPRRLLNSSVTIVNIDHHPDALPLGVVNWIETDMSSVGEMVYEYLHAVDASISPSMATSLYTAILTDTGRFRYPATTRRTMEIGGALIALGADPRRITDRVYFDMKPSTMILTGRVLNSIEFHFDQRVCLLYLTQEMLKESGADVSQTEGLVDYTLYSHGVLAGALLKEVDGGVTKVSLRSKDGINVAEIASQFGGGGHFAAAGCTINQPVSRAREMLLQLLKKAIHGR
ncbi:MAG: bifunctional oligoribonuclease/PAP phosphatase NrnA [candidate division Zixibacteria bacterium]|nr:bifunctional oligoribonuclease/PAP phosphatase NrnA [candidate division Zixibacteria bacterium]